MSSLQECCFVGRGKVYISEASSDGSWGFNWGYSWGTADDTISAGRFLGNVTSLVISPDHTFLQQGAIPGINQGIDSCATSIISQINVNMTVACSSSNNISDFLFGSTSKSGTLPSPVVDNLVVPNDGVGFSACDFLAFQLPGVDPSSVVVKDSALSVLVEGKDYVVHEMGIELLIGFLGNLTLSYTYNKLFECIEPFVNNGKTYQMVVDGINLAGDTGQTRHQVRFYRIRLSPSDFTVIGESFNEFNLSGILEADSNVKGSNKSQYLSIKRLTA